MVPCYVLSFVRRTANLVAHVLASKSVVGLGFSLWTDFLPSWLLGPLLRNESSG